MESTNRLRYLIAGTGGVGGSIAGFLHLPEKTSLALPVEHICKQYNKTGSN